MNANDSHQFLSESQLLINSLLSECLSDPGEEDISKAAFEAEFPEGKTFADKDTARLEIQSFSKANNIPFETCKSDKSYIKMICKHFGKYRAAKKGEDEEDIGTGKGLESDTRAVGQPWTIRTSCFEHNHPLSEDRRAFHNNRKFNAEDGELAIRLMRAGTTPSKTLKMLETRGVNNLIVTDLTNIQQQFCRDNHTNMWNFIKNLESSGHQVRYMTNVDERICYVFFIHQHGIEESRKLSEYVVIDATYKTNSYKMVLLNFVVADGLARGEITGNLPKCFVTDNDEALLGAIKSVFPESKQILCWIHIQRNFILRFKRNLSKEKRQDRNLFEMKVKSFMAIIKHMALTCATKRKFLFAKDAYEVFISTKGMCVKGVAQKMIKYLHSMMSTHASIERSNNTSSGSMAAVTEKIDLWIKKREDYRNLQSIKESFSQRSVFLEHDIADQLSLIRLNVSSFAFESIKNESIEMKASEENPDHVIYVRSSKNCLLPLSVVHQRWRISYVKGNVATVTEVSAELGRDSPPESGSTTNHV
ncbi:hypothetical protein INT47_003751 [Mucor saturninus]|uniref:MULE transposase domain-containing protein n=1 Tax=Mucor saturninus TaxID=64648 RepID=A0A8H7R812_9FUNG|nr:hypothetical protein INT47_003751 [Mucor saturninus]